MENSLSSIDVSSSGCRVCSDTPCSYNFDTLTCEPCKYFFDRNIYRLDELQCPRKNNCHIDRYTRKGCRKCRLVKCFKVGMHRNRLRKLARRKSPLIALLLEQSKKFAFLDKNILTESNLNNGIKKQHHKRINSPTENSIVHDSFTSTSYTDASISSNYSANLLTSVPSSSYSPDNPLSSYPVQEITATESEAQNIKSFQFCAKVNEGQFHAQPESDENDFTQEMLKSQSTNCDPFKVLSCKSVNDTANEQSNDKTYHNLQKPVETGSTQNVQLITTGEDRNGFQDFSLNPIEIKTIDNVVKAFYPVSQPLTTSDLEFVSVETFIQIADVHLEKLIFACRNLSFYSERCFDDQIKLVKFSFPIILAMEKYFLAISSTKNEIDDQLKLASSSIVIDYSLISHLIQDPKLVCILIAIVLNNPNIHGLRASDVIRNERLSYINLLKRYLESQCGSQHQARVELYNLINMINKLISTRQQFVEYFHLNEYYYNFNYL